MNEHKRDIFEFCFTYFDRRQAWNVLLAGIKLLITGECRMQVNMYKPRDLAMMEAAAKAAEEFDKNGGVE